MAALSEYREENTEIYNIVMATMDLSGNREETDVEYLARHYHHGIHRNGRGLIEWIDGLNDLSQVGEQDRLQTNQARRRQARYAASSGHDFHSRKALH